MKVLSEKSAKGRYYLGLFDSSMKFEYLPTISVVYGKYSRAKYLAYNDCIDIAFAYARKISDNIESGSKWIVYDWGVIAHNKREFTFGAILRKYDENANFKGVLHMVVTKENVYII